MSLEDEAFQAKTEPLDVGLILDGQDFLENDIEVVLVRAPRGIVASRTV
jgi:hypothetical protein